MDSVAVRLCIAEVQPVSFVGFEREGQGIVRFNGRSVIFARRYDDHVGKCGPVADEVKSFAGQVVGLLECKAAENTFHLLASCEVFDRETLVRQHRGFGEGLLTVIDVDAIGSPIVFIFRDSEREADEIGIQQRSLEIRHGIRRCGAFREDGGCHVHQAADRIIAVLGTDILGCIDNPVPEHVARKAFTAAFRDDERSYT